MFVRQSCLGVSCDAWLRPMAAARLGKVVLPLMRKYPHTNDSRMSTCLISTSTSYCWRSEVWLPLNRLPGRRRAEEELGRNCRRGQRATARDGRGDGVVVRTLCAGKGEDRWLAGCGEACSVRCSSAPSSVVVMGVGMSRLGESRASAAILRRACAAAAKSCAGSAGRCRGALDAASR